MDQYSPSSSQPWFAGGLRFKCTGCGQCCTGSSRSVYVSKTDIERLARFFDIPAGRLVRRYTRLSKGRRVLNDGPSGEACVFLKDNACTVYEGRPTQCRTYPWWLRNIQDRESWQEAAAFCEGIDHPSAAIVPAEEIFEQCRLDEENEANQAPGNPKNVR
ncbi:MAG TPA: YkgJ family cysteine cluster protein [Dehalococcoidia bacterium]|nr:YkgJ family cysteine cluster protein [Dehalococcoidia bacterium]